MKGRVPERQKLQPLPPIEGESGQTKGLTHGLKESDLQVIRVESVLSQLPVHNLTKSEPIKIHIKKTKANGGIDLLWKVSPSSDYGEPRILSYHLDTLVINQRIHHAGRPIPKVLKLGTLLSICRELGMTKAGKNTEAIRRALHQNAAAYITAKLTYKDSKGNVQRLEGGFTRYSVFFRGEQLPNRKIADGVYIVFHDVYEQVLNHVPVRPLDFSYLRQLGPSAQRFYEIVSFKIYEALKNNHPKTCLFYSSYCLGSAQTRNENADRMRKQMHKLHRPHLQSGYISKVEYEETLDPEGKRDWLIHYWPGPKARAEYKNFRDPSERRDKRHLTQDHLVWLLDDETGGFKALRSSMWTEE